MSSRGTRRRDGRGFSFSGSTQAFGAVFSSRIELLEARERGSRKSCERGRGRTGLGTQIRCCIGLLGFVNVLYLLAALKRNDETGL